LEQLIGGRLSDKTRARILRAAGGNPLFVQELLAMAREGSGEVEVPPNLQALLAARLDQLHTSERRVLERGAVEGEVFHLGSVAALTPEEPNVTGRLASLVRRALVRPDRSQLPDEDGFRFRHLLIRDAAYDSLPKSARADLHQRFAAWLDEHGDELVELDEIVGYHLEQAARYRAELGEPDAEFAKRASERLAAAGFRADARQDLAATATLLRRALALLPSAEPAVEIRLRLGAAIRTTEGVRASSAALLEGAELAARAGDRAGELRLRLVEASAQAQGGRVDEAAARRLAQEALALFEVEHDDVGQALAWELLAFLERNLVHSSAQLAAAERMLDHARAAKASWLEDSATRLILVGHIWGPTPLPEVDRILAEHPQIEQRYPTLIARHASVLGWLGRVEEGRQLIEAARARTLELGGWNPSWGQQRWERERHAGDLEGAEIALREEIEAGERAGMTGTNSSTMAYLAECLCRQGRFDEADEWVERSRALTAEDDAESEISWRKPRALMLARLGDLMGAESVAREAVAFADGTEDPTPQGETRLVLAEVLELAGKTEE